MAAQRSSRRTSAANKKLDYDITLTPVQTAAAG
jgi:hypothetical protein